MNIPMLKEKIQNRQPICGTHVQIADPEISSIYARMGYDYLWLDMEHSYLSYREALQHLNNARLHGTPMLVRLPQDDLTATKKILEMGPEGVIFPMVNNAADADRLIGYTLYPPYGTRGIGAMRAVEYGAESLEDYCKRDHLSMCRLIQLENKTAIENLEQILQNPFIDGYIFGPADLSGSLGDILNVTEGETKAWMQRAIAILKSHGKYIGISFGGTDPSVIRPWHDMGIDMISVGSDFGYILDNGRKMLEMLRREHIGRAPVAAQPAGTQV